MPHLLARTVFLLLGLLPLAASIGWATYRHVAFDATAYREWIAGQTGLDMRVRRIVHARPGMTRFELVNLVDPEDGELVARCDQAEVRIGQRAMVVHLPEVVVQPDRFQRLLELLHDRFLCQQRLVARPFYLVADSVSLPGINGQLVLTEFRLDVEKTARGPEAMLTFRWSQRPESELVRLHLIRDQSVRPASTSIVLLTGDTPLPCSLLWRLPGSLSAFGDALTFQGDLHLRSMSSGWSGQAAGKFANIRLEQLAALHLETEEQVPPSWLTGDATLQIRDVRFEGSWVQSMSGQLVAGPGQIDRASLRSIGEQLHLPIHRLPGMQLSNSPVEYSELAIDFVIEPHHTTLRGIAGGPGTHALLIHDTEQLVGEPTETLSPAALPQALLGLSPTEVPVSAHAHPLLRMFPLVH